MDGPAVAGYPPSPMMETLGSELGHTFGGHQGRGGFGEFGRGGFGGFGRGGWMRGPPFARFGCGVFRFLFQNKKVVAAVAVVVIGIKVAKWWKLKNLREKWNEAGKDVVVLHTVPRGYYAPCLTPFSVKLETYFRMMNIKYILDFEVPMGPKNKIPWITFNGKDYSDSELIIEMLQEKFNKKPDTSVAEVDRAIGVSMRIMLEEHLYWGLVHWRYFVDDLRTLFQVIDLPAYYKVIFKTSVKSMFAKALYLQGVGRHCDSDINRFMKRDIEALSVYLGEKKFMFGDEPNVVDCAVFACINQIIYNCAPSPMALWINDDFKNLKAYNGRMRKKYWPDWNKCILRPDLGL